MHRPSGANFLQHLMNFFRALLPGKPLGLLQRTLGEILTTARIGDHTYNFGGNVIGVFTLKQNRRVATDVTHGSAPAAEDWRPARQGFNHHGPTGFEERGENKARSLAEEQGHFTMRHITDELDPVSTAFIGQQLPNLADVLLVPNLSRNY